MGLWNCIWPLLSSILLGNFGYKAVKKAHFKISSATTPDGAVPALGILKRPGTLC